MEHAKSFNEFIPSVKEVKYYVDKWKNPNNKEFYYYKCLEQVFAKKAHTKINLFNKCAMLNIAYKCCSYVDYEIIVSQLMKKLNDNNQKKLQSGDRTIVDDLRTIMTEKNGSKDLYVFSIMFCHHSKPQFFYGFSRPICRTLVVLNKKESFYNIEKWQDFWDYGFFCKVMEAFSKKYGLKDINKTNLDIMLKGVYSDYAKEINKQFKEM